MATDQDDYFLLDTAQGVLMLDVDGVGTGMPIPLVRFVGSLDASFGGSDIYVGI